MSIERNHMMENDKIEEILGKINKQEERNEKKQILREHDHLYKHEQNIMRRIKKVKVIDRLQQKQEYQNELNKQKIDEKMLKAEEFKEQRAFYLQEKKKMAEKIAKQKSEVLSKFDKMMKKNGSISVIL